MTPKQILFSLKGRINRKTYWIYSFIISILYVFLLVSVTALSKSIDNNIFIAILIGIIFLILIWTIFAVTVKRLHDINCPGLCFVFTMIPIVAIFIGFIPGTSCKNKFGEVPGNKVEKTS